MSTPVARSLLTDADPLQPPTPRASGSSTPDPSSLSSSPLPDTPISFKRRQASSSRNAVRDKAASLLGGFLSRSNDDMVPGPPSLQRPDAPTHITLPRNPNPRGPSDSGFSQAVVDEDDDEEAQLTATEDDGAAGRSGFSAAVAGGRSWRRRQGGQPHGRIPSFAAGRSRRSTGTGMLSPNYAKEPGLLSPDAAFGAGGDGGAEDGEMDTGPIVVTPLPKIPILVLSICMLGEFLSASVCAPFLFLYVCVHSRSIRLTDHRTRSQHGGKLRGGREWRRRVGGEPLDRRGLGSFVRTGFLSTVSHATLTLRLAAFSHNS